MADCNKNKNSNNNNKEFGLLSQEEDENEKLVIHEWRWTGRHQSAMEEDGEEDGGSYEE